MQAYTITEFPEGLTPNEAEREINRIYAEIAGDREHPCLNKFHPQHKNYKNRMDKLYQIKNS
jgi:hypothetical protein